MTWFAEKLKKSFSFFPLTPMLLMLYFSTLSSIIDKNNLNCLNVCGDRIFTLLISFVLNLLVGTCAIRPVKGHDSLLEN